MPKIIAVLALPHVQLLDVSGPLDVFAQANVEAGREVYILQVVACASGPIRSSSGARLLPDVVVSDIALKCDTLIVAGAPTAARETISQSVLTWLKATVRGTRRYGSVCTGAFALAAAGLLDRRRVTTHWAEADVLAEQYPLLNVEPDALYIKDGKVRTAAGVTAGLDLALSLVEEDLGRDIAMRVASQLVMYFKRPGGQIQFSRKGTAQPTGRAALQEVQRWVVAHPALAHSVNDLAHHTGLSPRHFARLFVAEVGTTPLAWVETVRINAARDMLDAGKVAPKQVAAACGFANADTLRRTFVKHLGVTPAQYRLQYSRVEK